MGAPVEHITNRLFAVYGCDPRLPKAGAFKKSYRGLVRSPYKGIDRRDTEFLKELLGGQKQHLASIALSAEGCAKIDRQGQIVHCEE